MYRAKQRLHLTRDGRVVPAGDKDSAFLLVPEGGELSDEEAKKYGLMPGGGPAPSSKDKDDALPLDSAPKGQTSPQQQPAGTTHDFPETLHFGARPESPSNPFAPMGATVPPVKGQEETKPEQSPTTAQSATQAEQKNDLPDDFPYKSLLVAADLGSKEQLKKVTKDELITKDQIGSARADEILAAREKLG